MLRSVRRSIRRVPGLRTFAIRLQRIYWVLTNRELFPPGHYYSHTPDQAWIQLNRDRLFSKNIESIPGVDLVVDDQFSLLDDLSQFLDDFDKSNFEDDDWRYSANSPENDFFGINCAFLLYSMLRHFRPRRVFEVGSGFSSALMLDIDDRYLAAQTDFTFIDPYPQRLDSLLNNDDGRRCRILRSPVQEVELAEFEQLQDGDFLFIDSSHVSKIGSDGNFLLFEVLPSLNPGALIHFHDIHWPFEYREEFLTEGRFWNESYMLRSFLQYNSEFKVIMFGEYLAHMHRDRFQEIMPKFLGGFGGSLWIRRG